MTSFSHLFIHSGLAWGRGRGRLVNPTSSHPPHPHGHLPSSLPPRPRCVVNREDASGGERQPTHTATPRRMAWSPRGRVCGVRDGKERETFSSPGEVRMGPNRRPRCSVPRAGPPQDKGEGGGGMNLRAARMSTGNTRVVEYPTRVFHDSTRVFPVLR